MGRIAEVNAPGTLVLWHASLEVPEDGIERLQSPLNQGERHRQKQYATPLLQRRFGNARGILRHVLAHHVGVQPHTLRFELSAFGKPFLPEHPEWHFNVSHSGDVLLIGVAHVPIGVDLEVVPAHFKTQALMSFFSPEEQRHLQNADPASFFWCWTRKEAYLKAVGTGLVEDLHTINTLQAEISGWALQTFQQGAVVYSVATPAHVQIMERHWVDHAGLWDLG